MLDWIPVTERLPEPVPGSTVYGREVLVWVTFNGGKQGRPARARLNHYAQSLGKQRAAEMPLWFIEGLAAYGDITHWCEFNKPGEAIDEVAVIKDGVES